MSELRKSSSGTSELAESIIPYIYYKPQIEKLKNNANELLKQQRFQDAYEAYEQALPLIYQNLRPEVNEPITEEVLMGLVKCTFALNQLNHCKFFCAQILNSNPQNQTALLYLSLIYKQEGKEEKSEKFIKLACSSSLMTDNGSENELLLNMFRQFSDQTALKSDSSTSQEQKKENAYQDDDILIKLIASTILGSTSSFIINWNNKISKKNLFLSTWNSTCFFGILYFKRISLKLVCVSAFTLGILIFYIFFKHF